jgi:catalase
MRQICHFFRADPAYGIGVAKELGIDIDQFIPNGAAQPEAVIGKR